MTSKKTTWIAKNGLKVVLEEMDPGARRKEWNDNMYTPLSSPTDSLEEVASADSGRKLEKAKKNEGHLALPNRKCQEETNLKMKEIFHQNVKEPNIRDYKMNILNNGAGPSCLSPGSPQSPKEPGSPQAQVKSGLTQIQVTAGFPRAQGNSDFCALNNIIRARIRARSAYKIEGISVCPDLVKGSTPKIHVNVLNKELEELNLKCQKIESDFEMTEKELITSRQVSSEEFEESTSFGASEKDIKIEILRNDLSEKALTIKNLTFELQHSEQLIEKLSLENRKLKETIRKLKHQNYIGSTLLKEELQFYYKMEMKKIQEELNTLKADLETERAIQKRNKRALELLKKYFETKNSFGIFEILPKDNS
ncbi:coiled-coil domain-containing protein 160 [Sorex fumeus]|uniref:coiled-coil domain-containing protein 160 n=1 Tax=Sorex fumeus TaxID=62283 RepID=UPI0024AE43AE|nr:coiled-coil domain-containing protein 160 [Sorex fumeus]